MGTITVSRTELGKALDFASLGLSKRPVAPVLGGILVTVEPHALFLAAFDYETCATVRVDGQAGGAGRVLVAGSELAAVVKSLPKGRNAQAEVTAEDDGLIVVCGDVEAVLSSLPLEEYPALPPVPAESGLVAADVFARAVARAVACAGTDDTLPALTCVKVTSEAGMLELAATDRYRLAVDRVTWTGEDGADVLIPARVLTAFAGKADKHGKVSLHFAGDLAGLSDGTRTLITHVNPAEFPKHYAKLIPDAASAATTVLADAAALGEAVTRAGKLLGRNEPAILEISAEGITVIAMRDGDVASSQPVPAVLDGDAMTARFCPAYLASVLAGVEGEAWLSFASAAKPVLVTGDDGYRGVCMPVRLP